MTTVAKADTRADLSDAIVCLGYVALDLIVDSSSGRVTHRAGGTAANVASALSYLGRSSVLVARLGDDERGRFITDDLARDGVDTTHVRIEGGVETPAVVHGIERDGSHTFAFQCPTC